MNILINYLAAVSGGALSYLRNLTPLLAKKIHLDGNKLFILVGPNQLNDLGHLNTANITVVEVSRSTVRRILWERTELKKFLRKNSIDVLFTPYQWVPYVKGVRNISMIRNMEPFLHHGYKYSFKSRLRNYLLGMFSRRSLRQSDAVIAVSKFAEKYCIDKLQISRSHLNLIYHGRDESFSADHLNTDHQQLKDLNIDKPYIFTCGSILPYRQCERVIEAFTKTESKDDYCLVIAGSGTDKYYTSLIQGLINKHRAIDIRWLGSVPIEKMKALYRNAKLFVTATEIEACPNIAIEAMASGCHVVSSSSSPLPEIFDDSALYFEKNSSAKSVAKLIDLYHVNQTSLNEKALNRAKYFDWAKCSDQTYQVLINR